jgi:antitoxin VapB
MTMSRSSFPVTFEAIDRNELNACLSAWGHRMGPVRRPTGGWSHGLRHGGGLVAVAATDVLMQPRVAGLGRHEAVELSRLCASRPDLCRVALRLWRAFVFPALVAERGYRWAISYQDAAAHSGNLYRFDGWARIGVSRSGTDRRTGRPGRNKVIWGWREAAPSTLAEPPSGNEAEFAAGVSILEAQSLTIAPTWGEGDHRPLHSLYNAEN